MTDSLSNPITKVIVHMYKMGTGDCFVLKFMAKEQETFKMMIDCGTWNRKFVDIRPFISTLKKDVSKHVDVMVVTHEHKDHVLGFQAGKKQFTSGFNIDRIWMGWSENDTDEKVKSWKDKHGEKKAALNLAVSQLKDPAHKRRTERQLDGSSHLNEIIEQRRYFAEVLADFAELHVSGGEYKGSLQGMAVVKKDIANNNISYFRPGTVMENIEGLEGVRIYVLGPPELWERIRQESGEEGEAYKHNRELEESDLFLQALEANGTSQPDNTLYPFEEFYLMDKGEKLKPYERPEESWRRIDYDWLYSSGAFALRMNSLTNNLSLALAFEFLPSGKVILFPGDAEFGSWKSWHDINWKDKGYDVSTEDLLNRVVFYKVAHHLSHNGTARSIGLDMMTHDGLAAMATLDYDDISNGWKSTMPNRQIIRDLLEKTKGRTMILNETGLHYDFEGQIPLSDEIATYREKMSDDEKEKFKNAYNNKSEHYLEYVVTL